MRSIYETITEYQNCIEEICTYFDNQGINPELMLDVFWRHDSDINYDYRDFGFNNDEDTEFSLSVIRNSIVKKDKYTLAYVDNGCGDQFYIILDNNKER